MEETKSLAEYRETIEALPIFVVLDSLYAKNQDSPVAKSKPASRKYTDLAARLQDVLLNKLQGEPASGPRDFPFTTLFSISEMIIYSLTRIKDICLEVMNPEYRGDFLTCHSLNVAFISCKVGMSVELSYQQLTELGVAGLLHDIGMTKIDTDCYTHERGLSRGERTSIEEHPRLGWHFFKHLKNDFPWLLRVILEEHKRENNQGYPAQVTEEPHIYSKIIGACDSFEALSHRRIYRKAFHPADAMRFIIEAKEMFFDKNILRPMINSLSMYPVGSLVQLNNNRIGQVIETVENAPLRPVVVGVADTDGVRIRSTERFDLSTDNNLYITGLVYSDHYQVPEDKKVS